MLTIIPDLLTPPEVRRITNGMQAAQFVDGKTTASGRARALKENLQLDKQQSPEGKALAKLVKERLLANSTFQRNVRPRHVRDPMFSRYLPGMQYGLHVDRALMGPKRDVRTDVSVTLFLSQPDSYEGGELYMETPFGPQEVKLPAGAAVCYPSTTLHRVNPVTAGERLAAVTWVQSQVRSSEDRELLSDLERVYLRLKKACPEAEETDLAHKSLTNMIRRLADH